MVFFFLLWKKNNIEDFSSLCSNKNGCDKTKLINENHYIKPEK